MFFIYSCLILLYGGFIRLATLFSPKARDWVKGRKKQITNLKPRINSLKGQRRIWLHAASYGEYEMAKPIVEELYKDKRNAFIISFFSPSGFENTTFNDDRILKIYLPLDTFSNQKKIVDLLKPDKVVFIKYDFWFNLLRVLYLRNIPYYYTSLHLNANSYLFSFIMKPFIELLRKSKKIYCHNEESQQILIGQQFQNTTILGDTRIEQALRSKKGSSSELFWSTTAEKVIGFGSVIPSEYAAVQQVISDFPDYNFMIAPHDVDAKSIIILKKALALPCHQYSSGTTSKERVCIIDTLGDLKYLYRYCDIVYVGAGFDKGPHNVLEPLVYEIPTICGPNIEKFPMARLLQKEGFLTVVSQLSELSTMIREGLYGDKQYFSEKIKSFFSQSNSKMDVLIEELNS